jgi:LEA14-like dessication related protein
MQRAWSVPESVRVPQRARVAMVVALAVSAACVSLGQLAPPELHLVDLAFVEATLFESTLTATVRVDNDNPEPLVIDGAVVRLVVGGLAVGKGRSDARVEVPRLGSETIPLTVHLNNVRLATRLHALFQEEVVDYALEGTVYVLSGARTVRVPISQAGRLDLRGEEPEATRPSVGGRS